MRQATQDFLAYSRAQHALFDYEPNPRRLAALLGIRVISGRTNRGSAGPPAVIQLARDQHVARHRFTLLHEINHVLMQQAGLERDIAAEVDADDSDAHIEAVVNHAAGQMILPDPMVNLVCSMYGDTPEAILNLAVAGQASLPAALHRWVSRDPDAHRAAFITSGSYVAHLGTCNSRLPFWRFDRIPEVALAVPDAELRLVPRRQGAVLGTVVW